MALKDEIVRVAQAFVDLQQNRHGADYNMGHRFTRTEALNIVSAAEFVDRSTRCLYGSVDRQVRWVTGLVMDIGGQTGPMCVAVINLKGGVGKTTIAALLGRYAAANMNLDVLAIDLDAQANLSQAYMWRRYRNFVESSQPSVVEVFSGLHPPGPRKPSPTQLDIEDTVVSVGKWRNGGRLDLIPSRFDFSKHLTESLKPDESVLAKCIATHFQEKNLILIDCAPTESVFTTAAYHASRYVLVPVRPEFFATIGFPLLQRSLEGFRQKNKGHKIDVVGVVVNNAFYDGGNEGGPEKRRLLKEIRIEATANGWKLFRNELPHSRGFPKRMRGDCRHPGISVRFSHFAREFYKRLGQEKKA